MRGSGMEAAQLDIVPMVIAKIMNEHMRRRHS
jgi:hypothetical protein